MARKKQSKLTKPISIKRKKKKSVVADADINEGGLKITNDTVAEHREAVLSGAKRLAFPLQQSRHKVVIVSVLIIAAVLISSFVYSLLALYRYKSTNNFSYRVSQVIPFPIARINGDFVAYEDYLFEVRHTLYYYRSHGQEGVDIDSEAGKDLVSQVKLDALQKVKLDTLAQQIAKRNGITVAPQEINQRVESYKQKLGGSESSNEAFEGVLRDFYDWELSDLKRSVRLELIRQKLPVKLDTGTRERADALLKELGEGAKFTDMVEKYSDDTATKDKKGQVGLIRRTGTDLPVEYVEKAFGLKEGEVSGLVESPFGLYVIRVNKIEGDQVDVSHIFLQYFNVEEYLKQELTKATVSNYITLEAPLTQ